MSQKRFNSLNQLCEESKKEFSSFEDGKKLIDKMTTIANSENIPLDNNETALVNIIINRSVTNLFDLINKTNTENIPLSDEDLLVVKRIEENFPKAKKMIELSIKELEETSDINLQKIAQKRRDEILKYFEPVRAVLNNIIQKKEKIEETQPVDKQVATLQSKIKILEEKLRGDNYDPDDTHWFRQEIQKLKAELQKKQEHREREREREQKSNQLYSLNYWWRSSNSFLTYNNLLSIRE